MTGFGVGESPLESGKLCVEIRALNHRYCDVRARVPRELAEIAPVVEQLARERFTRGRFEIAVRVDRVSLGAPTLHRDRARAAYASLCALRDEVAPGAEVPFAMLAQMPDLYVSCVDSEKVSLSLKRAFDESVRALDQMRSREGGAMADELKERLATVRSLARRIAERAPEVVELQRKRLKERAQRLRLAAELGADGTRLEQEIALFAEKIDICEELSRLDMHCGHFIAL
jgi:uncharacterized protein (TIGR00255 family)